MTETHNISAELARIQSMYEARDSQMPVDDWTSSIYHPRNPLGRLFHSHNQDCLVRAVNANDLDLEGANVLDVGCGFGYWLRFLVEIGARPTNLTGIDLSSHRIETARRANPAINWLQSSSASLPFSEDSFDLVLQTVVFSSIKDDKTRLGLATEMLRVLRPGGHILWVDHKRAHGAELAGFSEGDVLKIFAGCEICYTDNLHPSYFRRDFFKRRHWLARGIYQLTRYGCDSTLFLLKKR